MRLTLGLMTLFSVISLASFAVAYLVLRGNIEMQLRDQLRDEMANFTAAITQSEFDDVLAVRLAGINAQSSLLSFTASDGAIAGNARLPRLEVGYHNIHFDDHSPFDDEDYTALTAHFDGAVLTLARSREPIHDLGELFANLALLSLAPTLILSAMGGGWLARISARRINEIAGTLERLAEGDLGARVPANAGGKTDLDHIANRVDRMATAQQAATAALKQVSADIAHDLKTPIQRVSLLLKQAAEPERNGDEARALVERAEIETQEIIATFQSLLQIAQIEGGSPKARFQSVDLAAIATNIFDLYEPEAEQQGKTIRIDVPAMAVMVTGDKALLQQALVNLLENALRHTPQGTKIALGIRQANEAAVIYVADSGEGIPEAERQNVLRRLYRLESSRTTPGHGLGLSLVAAIAALHNARLALKSNAPGLLVEILFPPVPLAPE